MPDRTVVINVVTRTGGAKKGINDLSRSVGTLDRGSASATKSLKTMNPQIGQATRGVSALAPGLAGTGIAAGGMAAGVIAVGAAVKGSISAFGDFEDKLNQSLAIMGDVSAALREEMSDAAREMAKTTRFSAQEAAQSYFYLASAGQTAEQAIVSLPAVASFAQAGMFDMALATDLLTDAQSALGLTVDDAAENMTNMVAVSDVFVKANTLANTSVQQVSEAITNKLGGSLRAYNIDLEEGVAVLAAYADQGLKGAAAGESFNIVLRDLKRAASENAAAFADAGIAVFDAQGNFRNMADIISDLEAAFGGLSVEQQTYLAAALGFQDRSFKNIQLLIGQADAVREYETALRNAAGTTEEVAGKQLESFNAQMGLIKDQIVDLGIRIGEDLAPVILDLAGGVTDLVTALGPLIDAGNFLWKHTMEPLLFTVSKVSEGVKLLSGRFDSAAATALNLDKAATHLNSALDDGEDPAVAFANAVVFLGEEGDLTAAALAELGRTARLTPAETAPAVAATLTFARTAGFAADQIAILEAALYDLIIAEETSDEKKQQLIYRHGLHAAAADAAADAVLRGKDAAEQAEGPTDDLAGAHDDAAAAAERQLTAEEKLAEFLAGFADPALKAAREMKDLKEAHEEVAQLAAEGKEGTEEFAFAQLELFGQIAATNAALAAFQGGNVTDAIAAIAGELGLSADAVEEMLRLLGVLDQTTVNPNIIITATGPKAVLKAFTDPTPTVFHRQHGGPVHAGVPYMVGERGPEMVIPQTAGMVIPNHTLTGSAATVNERNLTVTFVDSKLRDDPVTGIRAAYARQRLL